jgi:competence ComEA-like helix-hairpin-helix protein
MSWRNIFYYSSGERKVIILILGVTAIGIILFSTYSPSPESTPPAVLQTIAPDTAAQPLPAPPAPAPPVRQRTSRRTATGSKETAPGRAKRKTPNYPPRTEKLAAGKTVEINAADTAELKKIPGIGSAFAGRIVKYRNLLGGYHSPEQLKEVYGLEETWTELLPWVTIDTARIRRLPVNTLPANVLSKHPYINYRQAKAIEQLRKQKKQLSGWENLQLLNEFSETDKQKLLPYLSFE